MEHRRHFVRSRAASLLACSILSACGAGWRQPDTVTPGALGVRQQVQVWQGPRVDRWHAVVVTTDSISGVPWLAPVTCQTCRVAVSRATVDSVRLGNPSGGFWKSVGLGMGLLVGAGVIVCATTGCPQRD